MGGQRCIYQDSPSRQVVYHTAALDNANKVHKPQSLNPKPQTPLIVKKLTTLPGPAVSHFILTEAKCHTLPAVHPVLHVDFRGLKNGLTNDLKNGSG